MSKKLTKQQQETIDAASGQLELAHGIHVTNAASYESAAEALKGIKSLLKEADRVFDPAIKKAHEAHRAMIAAKREVTDPLSNAEVIIKTRMVEWRSGEERKARAEERRLTELARQQAEEDRAREAEAMRAVDPVVADEIERAPLAPPPVTVQSSVPKVAGVVTKTLWRARVVDVVALLAYVYEGCAERPDLLKYIKPDESMLNAEARATKGAIEIPGVEFYSETSIAAG